MSRYIIELDYDLQRVVGVGVKQGTVWVKDYDVDDLEELCADYINEHFGDLQDTAYQRGLEDGKQTAVGAAELREKLEYQKGFEKGKDVRIKGCEGCMYQDTTIEHNPCNLCCNAFLNRWAAKDDKIEVGDEVETQKGTIFVITKVTADNLAVGFTNDGSNCIFEVDRVVKTGRHFDIESILEAMKE